MSYFRTDVPDTASELFDGEVVIAHYGTGLYFSIGPSGALIWQGLGHGLSVAETAAWLAGQFPADAAVIPGQVETFIADLVAKALLVEVAEPTSAGELPAIALTTWREPAVESFDDLQELLLLDPVHDVTEAGWPIGPMTRHNHLRAFIDDAFARSTLLCRARFGELVADVFVDERAAPQGFERALLTTDAPAEARFAIITGSDPVRMRYVPDRADCVHVLADADFYAHWRPAPDAVFSVFDPATRHGVVWYPEEIAPAGGIGYPCVPLIHAALQKTGWCIAHTASVGRYGRQLLLTGPGKAGKSTAALACMRAGWDYAGDDLVLLDPSRGLVQPMFSSARLRHSGAAEFPALADSAFMVSDEDGHARFEIRLQVKPKGGEVVAILGIQRRGAQQVEIGPGRLAEYMGALLRDSNNRAPGYSATTTRKLLSVGRMAPLFAVDTGTNPSGIPAGLEALLERTA